MRVAAELVARQAAPFVAPAGVWSGSSAVVVDVLRATTTLSVALAHGALGVEACVSTAAALHRRDGDPARVLACGERDGRIVPGFDLGNSPFEYDTARVAGKILAFASTNGSLALASTATSRTRWLGAFVNASAVLEAVWAAGPPRLRIVCAGKEGRFSLEDAAFAGWLATRLAARGATLEGAAAHLAAAIAPPSPEAVRAAVEGSSHGRALRRLGADFARDVAFCATLDRLDRAYEV